MKYLLTVLVLLFTLASLTTSPTSAAIIDVSVDTSDLANHPLAAPFYIDFTLTSSGNTVNTATISDVTVTGGLIVPLTGVATGNATGSLDTTLTLSDANPVSGFNDFYQEFNPGSKLSFEINLSTNITSVDEDTLTFSIYDQSQGPIATQDSTPGEDSLFLADLVNPGPVYTAFASDPSVPLDGDVSGASIPAPTYSVSVPEPVTFMVLAGAFPVLMLRCPVYR